MACPTCDHTMQLVDDAVNARKVSWCPWCGTLKVEPGLPEFQEQPKIVHRAFMLCEAASGTFDDPGALDHAIQSVRECCENPQED